MKKILFVAAAAIALAGCASGGNKSIEQETQVGVQSKIIKGKTTKQGVKAIYGDPTSVSLSSDGKEQWHYVFTNTQVSGKAFIPIYGLFDNGATTNMKQLIIVFNGDVVDNYLFNNSKTEVKTGILN
ncbi:outer membrane protein assembly factor BamE domain-containing protein [Serratia entomophila]|uniref:outer membrane protein assembly factor BamE domain-containing protein n=1 Tax=Serratia entomophila TaxID=42906 RepID=UPI0021B77C25|nr:outer membrane protein assembly factor BamE [Serratia entomophila]